MATVLQGETQRADSVPSVQMTENTNAVNAGDQSVYGAGHPVEAAGFEPPDSDTSPSRTIPTSDVHSIHISVHYGHRVRYTIPLLMHQRDTNNTQACTTSVHIACT